MTAHLKHHEHDADKIHDKIIKPNEKLSKYPEPNIVSNTVNSVKFRYEKH